MAEPSNLAAEANDLARALARLSPSWRDPEQFHLAKSEITGRLRSLSRQLATEPGPRSLPSGRPRPPEAPTMRFVPSRAARPEPALPFIRARSLPVAVAPVGTRRLRLRLLPPPKRARQPPEHL